MIWVINRLSSSVCSWYWQYITVHFVFEKEVEPITRQFCGTLTTEHWYLWLRWLVLLHRRQFSNCGNIFNNLIFQRQLETRFIHSAPVALQVISCIRLLYLQICMTTDTWHKQEFKSTEKVIDTNSKSDYKFFVFNLYIKLTEVVFI